MTRDKYEQQFIQEIKQSAKKIHVDRQELGEIRLKRMVALIYLLIQKKQEQFDLIVFGGNSGAVALEITKMVYQNTDKKLPPLLSIPVVRPSNIKDISVGETHLSHQIDSDSSIKNILFIDDEITRGQTAKICFETILNKFAHQVSSLNCTIIAENHFFVWRYQTPQFAIRFLPFAMVLQGYNGNFGYLIPQQIINNVQPILFPDNHIDRNQLLALLLAQKRKITINKIAKWDNQMIADLNKKIPDFTTQQNAFIKKIHSIVHTGIQELNNHTITFDPIS